MKYNILILILILILVLFIGCTSTPSVIVESVDTEIDTEIDDTEPELPVAEYIPQPGHLPVTAFPEIWGYVIVGQEAALRRGLPITDVGYFGAEVDIYGKLSKVPNRNNLSAFRGRVHLTVTCGNYALTYFALMPGSPQRRELIADLIAATQNFDGLNIDFENIPERSGEAFLSFLAELKHGLPDKILSVCLYGRVRTFANDVYDYAKIAPLADRIFVMAYDQHWGGGPAGPVSSLSWCRSAAAYSLRVIGAEKLIMGIPFYGRAWANQFHHRALTFANTQRIIDTYHVRDIRRENGTPTFDYNARISVKVYYEDEVSIGARLVMYKSMGVRAVGFWRIGQETPKVWDILRVE